MFIFYFSLMTIIIISSIDRTKMYKEPGGGGGGGFTSIGCHTRCSRKTKTGGKGITRFCTIPPHTISSCKSLLC